LNKAGLLNKKLYIQAVRKAKDYKKTSNNRAEEVETLTCAKMRKFEESKMPHFTNFINGRAEKIAMNAASQKGRPDDQFRPYLVAIKEEFFLEYLRELNVGFNELSGIVQIEISYIKTSNVIAVMLLKSKEEKNAKD